MASRQGQQNGLQAGLPVYSDRGSLNGPSPAFNRGFGCESRWLLEPIRPNQCEFHRSLTWQIELDLCGSTCGRIPGSERRKTSLFRAYLIQPGWPRAGKRTSSQKKWVNIMAVHAVRCPLKPGGLEGM